MRAVIYARISDDRTGQRAGVTRQEEDCRAVCERNGWQIVDVLVDNDLSAYRGKPRPGYQRMLAMLAAVDVVVAWHPDRLTRHPTELEALIDALEGSETAVQTVTAGTYDLSTPSGRMQARIVGATARYESEHRSERVKAASRSSMLAGKVWGRGRRPYGYTPDRSALVQNEAAVVRETAQRVLAGESARSVAIDLNERGIPNASGKQWQSSGLLSMLRSAHLAGYRTHNGEIVARAVWPAIIDEATHRRLHALLTDPSRRRGPRKRDYLLSGILTCLCGSPLAGGTRTSTRGQGRIYRCHAAPGRTACGGCAVTADPCEAWTIEAVIHALTGPALVAHRSRSEDAAPLLERVAQLEADLDAHTADYSADLITRAQFLALTESTRGKLDDARRRLAATGPGVDVPDTEGELRARWERESFGWRRGVILTAVERIDVGPAVRGRNFFDPDRLDPAWRF